MLRLWLISHCILFMYTWWQWFIAWYYLNWPKRKYKGKFCSLFMIWHQWVNTHDRYLWFTMRCHQKSISLHVKGIWIISSTGFLCSHFDGLVQERRNSIANTLELRLSCTNPLICCRGMIIWQGARIIAQVMAACGLAPLPCHLGAVSI